MLIALILLIVLLHFSLTITIHAGRDGFVMKAKYLFLTLYPRKKKKSEDEDDGETDDLSDDDLTDEQLMQGLTPAQEQQLLQQEDPPESADTSEETKPPAVKPGQSPQAESKPPAESSSDAEEVSEPEEEKPKKKKKSLRGKIKNLRRKYEKFKPYIPITWKTFKKLLKTVRIYVDDLWVDVGRDDAHEAAIFYGSIQGAIGGTLAGCAKWLTLKVKRWNVNCRFTENVIDGGADITVRIRPSTVLALLVLFGLKFLIVWIKRKSEKKKAAKAKAENAAVQ